MKMRKPFLDYVPLSYSVLYFALTLLHTISIKNKNQEDQKVNKTARKDLAGWSPAVTCQSHRTMMGDMAPKVSTMRCTW